MTAAELLSRLTEAGCAPAVDGADLTLDCDPPPELEPLVQALHTGLRALLSGRRWFAVDADGRGCGPGIDHALDARRPLPRCATYLCVEGFAWNCLGDSLRRLPELFDEPPAERPPPPGPATRPALFDS